MKKLFAECDTRQPPHTFPCLKYFSAETESSMILRPTCKEQCLLFTERLGGSDLLPAHGFASRALRETDGLDMLGMGAQFKIMLFVVLFFHLPLFTIFSIMQKWQVLDTQSCPSQAGIVEQGQRSCSRGSPQFTIQESKQGTISRIQLRHA